MIRYCIYAVSVSLFILVSYVNFHMFAEKLKDISILITLGMKRSEIAIRYSKEMILISVLGLIVGVIGGVVCSCMINVIISLVAYKYIIHIQIFYIRSFVETCVFFAIIYVGITLVNIVKVLRKKPRDLMDAHKAADIKRISKIAIVCDAIVLCACYVYIGYNLKIYFSLGRHYAGNIPHYESNRFQMAVFAAILGAVFFTIKMIAYVLTIVKKDRYV